MGEKSFPAFLNLGDYDDSLEICVNNLVAFFNNNLKYKNRPVSFEEDSFYIFVKNLNDKLVLKCRISAHTPDRKNGCC